VNTNIKLLAAIFSVFILSACATNPAPPSAIGLYGDSPGKQKVNGSRAQVVASRTFSYTYDDVFEAPQEGVFKKGLEVEKADKQTGKIIGSGWLQEICGAGPCLMSSTFAIYIEQISPEPKTRFEIVLDRHGFTAWGGEQKTVNNLLIEIQKVLGTY